MPDTWCAGAPGGALLLRDGASNVPTRPSHRGETALGTCGVPYAYAASPAERVVHRGLLDRDRSDPLERVVHRAVGGGRARHLKTLLVQMAD